MAKNSTITDWEEYKKNALARKELTKGEKKLLKRILRTSLENRKLEIELSWQRGLYFLGLVAGTATAYITLLSAQGEKHYLILTLLSALGTVFSFGWNLAARGGKYWQENWERQVNILEGALGQNTHWGIKDWQETGDVPKVISLKEYPFSVSKINQFMGLVITFGWLGAFFYSLYLSLLSILHPLLVTLPAFLLQIEQLSNLTHSLSGICLLIGLMALFTGLVIGGTTLAIFAYYMKQTLVSDFTKKDTLKIHKTLVSDIFTSRKILEKGKCKKRGNDSKDS
ncbi:RipA family octameric membrane protein [Dermabacteraceae bacterium P13138]